MEIIILVIIVIFAIAIGKVVKDNKNNKKANETFDKLKDFTASRRYVSQTSGISMAFDKQRSTICFLIKKTIFRPAVGSKVLDPAKEYIPIFYAFDKILQCELMTDSKTILKKSVSGGVGGAILGDVLAGGVGAIIGGSMGSSALTDKIKSVDLKIIINDTSNPVFKVNFFKGETKKGSSTYKTAYNEAEKWHSIFVGLIAQDKDLKLSDSSNIIESDQFVFKDGTILTLDMIDRIKEYPLLGIRAIKKAQGISMDEAKEFYNDFDNRTSTIKSPVTVSLFEKGALTEDDLQGGKDLQEELMSLVKSGNILGAIKFHRDNSGASYKEAKEYIDSLK